MDVFTTYFAPFYSPEAFPNGGELLPDAEEIVLAPGQHIESIQPLTEEFRPQAAAKVHGMADAFLQDGPRLLGVEAPLSREWVKGIDRFLSPSKVQELLDASDPTNIANPTMVLCCEFGAGIGEVLRQERRGAQWIIHWPYWDSFIFDLNSKSKFPVFHWAIKRFVPELVDELLTLKLDAALAFCERDD